MKFTVNEILVSYIKNLRKENKITVTAFSQAIGKSKSYVTKFDNCEFKTITYEDFVTIFKAISPDDAERYMDEYFLSLLKNDYAKKNIDLEIDLANYSNVIRPQHIPEQFVNRFNYMLESKGLTVHDIIEVANENPAVKHCSNYNLVPDNEYSPAPVSDIGENEEPYSYIKVKLDEKTVKAILDREVEDSYYFILLAMVNAYYLIDIEKIESEDMQKHKYKIASIAAQKLLFNFHVESLRDHYQLEEINKQMEKMYQNLKNVSHSIQGILGGYVNLIASIYTQNYAYAERKVAGLDKNLEADAGFTVAAMDLPFYKVKHLNKDNKKKLLKDIANLIENYSKDEDYQNQIDLI